MGLKLRLARGGSKKRPYYRIVVADARAPRDGRFIEKVGTYNPMLAKNDEKRVTLVTERVKYWLGEGAEPTDRVKRFLASENLADAREIPTQTTKHLQSERTKMKIEERAEKRKNAAEARAEAEEQAQAEAPAESEAPADTETPSDDLAQEPVSEESAD